MSQVQFHLKSYRKDLLEQTFISLKKLQSLSTNNKEIQKISYDLKQKKKKLTVNRSPHVHKKSREQFALNSYHSIFTVKVVNLDALLFLLKSCSFYGVQMKITVRSQSFFLI